MAAFSLDDELNHTVDFEIVSSGGLTLFRNESTMAEVVADLDRLGYDTVALDATSWSKTQLHTEFAARLSFPDYYGHNLSALEDCLRDVAHGAYGWNRAATGLAVSILGYGALHRRDADLALTTADILSSSSRTGLLFGFRLIWLLHVSDAPLTLGPLGCFEARLNHRDWPRRASQG